MTPEKPQQDTSAHSEKSNAGKSEKQPAVEPSGPRGDNPGTAGQGKATVSSNTPENRQGHLSPSAPGDTGTTPGTTGSK